MAHTNLTAFLSIHLFCLRRDMKIKTILPLLLLTVFFTSCLPTHSTATPTPTTNPAPSTKNPPTPAHEPIPTKFVSVQGDQFSVNGQSFRFGGANSHELPWLSPAEMEQVLADANQLNFRVLRTFASIVIGEPAGTNSIWDYNAQGSNGVWFQAWDPATKKMIINDGPNGLVYLDGLLAEAARQHVRLVIAFVDNWYYYGGTSQYCAWHNRPYKRWCPDFYTDPAIKEDFKAWITTLLDRTNSITGVAYRDDPTILAWQLANEPAAETDVLLKWIDEMTSLIRAHDPNHLISLGDTGFGRGPADFARLLDAPNIDYGTLHLYPAYEQPAAIPADCDRILMQYIAIAKTNKKPVVLEEFGFSAAEGDQLAAYGKWLETMQKSGGSGWMVWRLLGRRQDGFFPPQDGEGFNIYNDNSPVTNLLGAAAGEIYSSTAP